MPVASQGSAVVLKAQFYDPDTTQPMDPSTLQFQILYDDPNNPATPGLIVGPITASGLLRTGLGAYQYTLIVPTNLTLGDYQAQWVAIVNTVPQFNFDVLTVVAPSADNQTAQTALELSNDSHILVDFDGLFLKFDVTPKAVSVYNGSYSLYRVLAASEITVDYDAPTSEYNYDLAYEFTGEPGATNVFVGTPFLSIQAEDYNSISRVLRLNFSEQLIPNAQYALHVSGIIDAAGLNVADFQYLFSVPENVVPNVIPVETPVLVEDHSVLQTPFTNLDVIEELNPAFYITSTNPDKNLIYIDQNYANGRITVTFNIIPSTAFLNDTYFTVQWKPLSRSFNRWSSVPGTVISADPLLPNVYIDLPSLDAIPVYNQSGSLYYQNNSKYRIKISEAVTANNTPSYNNLQGDQFFGCMINPYPFLVDPDIIQDYFPEADLMEIAELIYDSSQEIVDFFDNGDFTQTITPTIRSTMEDFVIANVCCALQRIYDIGGVNNQIGVTLGDLTVNQGNAPKTLVGRSNATTWCELAGVIRNEVYNLSSKSGIRAVVKGSRLWNPIPRRHIEYQEWRSWGWDRDSIWSKHYSDNNAEWRNEAP